jgi:hypothetical protein
MAGETESATVGKLEAKFWKVGERLNVVGLDVTAALAAELTGEVVSLEDC